MEELVSKLLEFGPEVLEALLAILGGLKVVAKLTKSDWDDKLLEKAFAPIRFVLAILPRKK